MRTLRRFLYASSAGVLAATLFHTPAGAAAPGAGEATASPDTKVADKPAPSTEVDACASENHEHKKLACTLRKMAPDDAEKRAGAMGNNCSAGYAALKDADLALAVEYAAPGEFKCIYESVVGTTYSNQAAIMGLAGGAFVSALKQVWKATAPELKAYAKRRLGHERRARIVASLADGLCREPASTRSFPSTCAVVQAYASSHQGGVASLAVLGSAARVDLARLNATVVAGEHASVKTAAARLEKLRSAVQVMIVQALRDNRDGSILQPLIKVLRAAAPDLPREACALQLTRLAEDMTRADRATPVTSVVWAGLTALPECRDLVGNHATDPVADVIKNAELYPRGDLQWAAPLLQRLLAARISTLESAPDGSDNKGGAKATDEAKPAEGTKPAEETKPAVKEIPAGLRHLEMRLHAAAALAEVLCMKEKGVPLEQDPGAGAWLQELAESLEISAAYAVDDYAGVAARAARRLQAFGRESEIRHIDLIVVLATQTDEEKLERTLADAVGPARTWRVKARRGSFHVTLSAMPGVMTAAEWREGPYGSTVEKMTPAYQPPSLQMPIGFDVSWGIADKENIGLFFSTIDPLAFLQYDAYRGGRLPGPSVLTALAPGLGVRFSLGRSPLSLMPFVVFRPKLRAWEPNIAGQGAHALQVGIALTFDLVLINLVNR